MAETQNTYRCLKLFDLSGVIMNARLTADITPNIERISLTSSMMIGGLMLPSLKFVDVKDSILKRELFLLSMEVLEVRESPAQQPVLELFLASAA